MAHPKRKISKTRRDKRRTHYKASTQQITTCPTTGEAHQTQSSLGRWHSLLQRKNRDGKSDESLVEFTPFYETFLFVDLRPVSRT